MEISAAVVKELREKTGLGMMLCKKALTDANGDMTLAIETLRKQGQATAEKRAGKAAKQGKVSIVSDASASIVYEVNSETDFVAKNDDFVGFIANLGTLLLSKKPSDITAAKALTSDAFGGQTVDTRVLELVGKIGENISFRKYCILKNETANEKVFTYVHGEGRLGILVKLSSNKPEALSTPAFADLGKDIAMQIAAANPLGISRELITKDKAEFIAKEKEIYLTQAQTSGKPEKVWEKIVEGKVDKFFKEAALLEQGFIRDPEHSVTERIKETEKATEATVGVVSFVRFELGAEE